MSRASGREMIASSAGYFITQIVVMLGGFVSMPLLTRLMSKEQFGVLNLALASVGVLSMVGRLGFPQTAMRFFVEESERGPRHLQAFCEGVLGGALVASLVTALVASVATGWMTGWGDYAALMRAACVVVIARVTCSVVYQLYRAQERVVAYSIGQIGARYGTLGLVTASFYLMGRSAYDVMWATAIAELAVAAGGLIDLAYHKIIRWPRPSWPTIMTAVTYGIPLTASSSASFVLDYGDRFLIQHLLGFDAVANYAVPYDLAQNIASALLVPINFAVVPILLRQWTREGPEATSLLFSRLTTYLVALMIPIGVLALTLSREMIVFLASSKYADSAHLTAYILPGVFIGQLNFLFVIGLMINKETPTLAVLTLVSGILNVILNLVLIPFWGLAGAGAATTVAYATLMVTSHLKSRKVLPLHLGYPVIAKSILASAIMAALVMYVGPLSSQTFVDLAVRGSLGVATVALFMLALEPEVRALSGVTRALAGGR